MKYRLKIISIFRAAQRRAKDNQVSFLAHVRAGSHLNHECSNGRKQQLYIWLYRQKIISTNLHTISLH